ACSEGSRRLPCSAARAVSARRVSLGRDCASGECPGRTALLAAFTDGYSTYAGGKSPVEHFTRAAAKEFADRGISVTAIAPGPMDTPFFYGQETPERVEFHKSQGMGGQLTKIEDIAPIVRFLASEGWWITGQTIFANGGYTTR